MSSSVNTLDCPSHQMNGNIYIASMNMRGSWATAPDDCIKINVTSVQAKLNKNRLSFSPMTPIDGGYKGFWNFEHYWQSGKVFDSVSHKTSVAWWQKQDKPKRRYPGAKTMNVLHAKYPHIEEPLNYIESRKQVYVVEYYDLIKNNPTTHYWQQQHQDGKHLVIYDFDGPRQPDGQVTCCELNLKLLREKILDTKHPFGHGYVIAATIANINPTQYI